MQSLEGIDSEYDKKAILAALDHLSRCLEPEPNRPPEVRQGMGKIGIVLRWVTVIPSRLCMGQKVASCPKGVSYPRFLIIKPDRHIIRQAQNPLMSAEMAILSVEKNSGSVQGIYLFGNKYARSINGNHAKCNMLRNKMIYAMSPCMDHDQERHAGNNCYHSPG
jgi:hypothetical protein